MLVLDAVETAVGPREVALTGDVLEDLAAVVRLAYDSMAGTPAGRVLPSIGVDLLHQPDLAAEYRRRFVDPLRDLAVSLIRRGVDDGVFVANGDVVVTGVVDGPIAVAHGNITISGRVNDDVVAIDGRVTLTADAVVHGDVHSSKEPHVAKGAQVSDPRCGLRPRRLRRVRDRAGHRLA